MGYWGWRPLVCCILISVWVVGCNIVSDASPSLSPTPSPRVTLTLRRLATATPTTSAQVVARSTTPAPVVSPQSSPTAVLYIVLEDDTLGDIALEFGVDVGALQAANNGLDPRSLQPGQQLIIPQAGVSMAASPTPTATPPVLPLEPPTCYDTPANSLLCLGEVTNTLSYPIEQVALNVELLQADGTVFAAVPVGLEQAVIPVGESSPYRVVFDIDPETVSGVSAVLTRADAARNADARFVSLDVENDALSMTNGRYVVAGELSNTTDAAAQDIRVVVILRDDEQHVIGYRVAQAGDTLGAGERLPIRVELVAQPTDGTPTYSIYVEARRVVE